MVLCRATACWVRYFRYSELSLVFSWASPIWEGGNGSRINMFLCFGRWDENQVSEALQDLPGSCKWCNPPSRAVKLSETLPYSHIPLQPDDSWKTRGELNHNVTIHARCIWHVLHALHALLKWVPAHLRATLRERVPWYLVLMVKAFSRNLRDKSYSITPWSTSPILLCVNQKQGDISEKISEKTPSTLKGLLRWENM